MQCFWILLPPGPGTSSLRQSGYENQQNASAYRTTYAQSVPGMA